jgi:hypothetical protein
LWRWFVVSIAAAQYVFQGVYRHPLVGDITLDEPLIAEDAHLAITYAATA